MGGWIITSKHK